MSEAHTGRCMPEANPLRARCCLHRPLMQRVRLSHFNVDPACWFQAVRVDSCADQKQTSDHSCCRHGCCPALCACPCHGSLSGSQKDMQAVPSCRRCGLCQQIFCLSKPCPPLQYLQRHRKAKRETRRRMIVSISHNNNILSFMLTSCQWHLSFSSLQVPTKILSTCLKPASTCEPTLFSVSLRSKSFGRTTRSTKVVCRVNTRYLSCSNLHSSTHQTTKPHSHIMSDYCRRLMCCTMDHLMPMESCILVSHCVIVTQHALLGIKLHSTDLYMARDCMHDCIAL